jgi:4-hydroxy-tetrahydrodipicolinate synthase
MLNETARGVYAIAPTPFHNDGRIDENSIDRMVELYGQTGCIGIRMLGLMGEAPNSVSTRRWRWPPSLSAAQPECR